MNELGLTAPESSPQTGGGTTSDAAAAATVVGGLKRQYTAPAIIEFGSVQEFTRGSGSATLDVRRSTRVRSRG